MEGSFASRAPGRYRNGVDLRVHRYDD